MILDEKVNVKISSTNFKYYKVLGYNFKKGDTIEVDVKHLQRGTGVMINVKCDICGSESNIYLQKYNINHERQGYYSCMKCSDIKRKKTNIEKYGSDNVSKNEIIKNKKKITTIKNYNVENPSQSKEIKDRKKETMMENYGVEYVFQSEKLRNNIKNIKYKKYGDANYNNRNESKITCLKEYGVENVSQNDKVKKKKCETSMKNYGVEYPSQNKEVFSKQQKSAFKILKYKDTNLYYQGTYELDFLEKYYNKLKISKNKKSIKYIYNNKIKYYHPDFYYKKLNLIIEIKSDYTLIKELDKNIAKRKYSLNQGYNFIFVINKDYSIFDNLVF